MSLASFSSLVQCLWVRLGAYPRGQHLKRCSTWVGSNLTHKHWTRLEKLVRTKHSSLLRKFINYRWKRLYNSGPRVMIHMRGSSKMLCTLHCCCIVMTFKVGLKNRKYVFLKRGFEVLKFECVRAKWRLWLWLLKLTLRIMHHLAQVVRGYETCVKGTKIPNIQIIRKDCFQVKSDLLTDFWCTTHMNIMILKLN